MKLLYKDVGDLTMVANFFTPQIFYGFSSFINAEK